MTEDSHGPMSHGPSDRPTDKSTDKPAGETIFGQPPPPPGRTHLLWDNGSGTAAVWRLGEWHPGASGPEDGEAADRQQFGPFTGWAARGLAVGPGGRVYLLWAGPGRAASVWSVDMEAGAARHVEYGPYDVWEARALAVGPDGVLRVLWVGAGGSAALWSLPEQNFAEGGVHDSLDCGPFAGWTAQALAVGPDNRAHLLWTRGDGAASVWLVGADGRTQPSEYGPYDGWSAVGVAAGRDGGSCLLWRGAGGYASLWDVRAPGVGEAPGVGQTQEGEDARAPDERPQAVHGPFAGWTPAAVARGGDGAAHLLWRRDGGGLASVWRLDATGGGSHRECGPFAGWMPVALALGP